MEWPRIWLPGWPDGEAESSGATLAESAARGRQLAALLDPETSIPGVTRTPLRSEIAAISVPCTVGERNMIGEDFAVTAGWGTTGRAAPSCLARVVLWNVPIRLMNGKQCQRSFPPWVTRRSTFISTGRHFWRNIPAAVWSYTSSAATRCSRSGSPTGNSRSSSGGLQAEEIQHFTDTARRIGTILRLTRISDPREVMQKEENARGSDDKRGRKGSRVTTMSISRTQKGGKCTTAH